ncbi:MAG TPA: hypothetical protein VMC06_15180 [Opitutaceae bacterium]|nr:hypothetical protein [Opitutaceae bacterium]
MPDPKNTAQDWNEVRASFATSIMVDTPLKSLAQNLDGPDWPIPGQDETPSTYIDLTFDEVRSLLARKGQPAACIDQLVAILRETLAFDSPFGEMVDQVEASEQRDNQLLKNLARLEIPAGFPIEFVALEADTREFCQLEKLTTVGEFAVFAQGLSQNVIVGGDFRALLNALAQNDEQALAKFLPLRAGTRGLHMPEALALGLRTQPLAVRAALARKAGAKLASPEAAAASSAPKDRVQTVEAELRERAARLAAEWFKADLAQLQQQVAAGAALARLLVVLGDPLTEAVVADLLKAYLKTPSSATGATAVMGVPAPPRRGFFARLFGRK